jgi:hypothetical protein
MIEEPLHIGVARHVEDVSWDCPTSLHVRTNTCLLAEWLAWNENLAGQTILKVPPKNGRRSVVDLENYNCAYTTVSASGSAGASL